MEKKEIDINIQFVRSRIFFYASMTVLSIGMGFVILIFYWYNAPYKILEIKNHPVPVIPKEVNGLRYVTAIFDFCKHKKIEGKVEVSLVSTQTELPLPDYDEVTKPGCQNGLEAPLPIPPQTATGVYHYHYIVTYHPNPLRTITVEFDTQEFSVVKTGAEGQPATRE